MELSVQFYFTAALAPWKGPPMVISWMDPKADLCDVEKRKVSLTSQESNDSSVIQPVTWPLYRLSTLDFSINKEIIEIPSLLIVVKKVYFCDCIKRGEVIFAGREGAHNLVWLLNLHRYYHHSGTVLRSNPASICCLLSHAHLRWAASEAVAVEPESQAGS
jgi:hypothetical protein